MVRLSITVLVAAMAIAPALAAPSRFGTEEHLEARNKGARRNQQPRNAAPVTPGNKAPRNAHAQPYPATPRPVRVQNPPDSALDSFKKSTLRTMRNQLAPPPAMEGGEMTFQRRHFGDTHADELVARQLFKKARALFSRPRTAPAAPVPPPRKGGSATAALMGTIAGSVSATVLTGVTNAAVTRLSNTIAGTGAPAEVVARAYADIYEELIARYAELDELD